MSYCSQDELLFTRWSTSHRIFFLLLTEWATARRISYWSQTELLFTGWATYQRMSYCSQYKLLQRDIQRGFKYNQDWVMIWKHFLHYWPFVKGFHQSPVDSLHKGPIMQNFCIFFVVSLNRLLNNSQFTCDLRCLNPIGTCTVMTISMGWCKKDVTPLLIHWSYVFLALTHRYDAIDNIGL